MGRSNGSRKCRGCGNKRRIDLANLMCAECNGMPPRYEFDESPVALRGTWVPNGRGTLVYVEQVAS